ncbi:MAG: response regulator [Deltaproteobacteria bacterium]|nr:response regulator [Deltaproteobacteria bacterium]
MDIIQKLRKQIETEIRLLVVDDEANVIASLKRILMDEGFPVDYCTNPLEALKNLKQHSYALVISDNMMPQMTGIELLASVKSMSAHTSRILLTGQTEAAEAIKAFNKKTIHLFINKPWDNQDLLKQIHKALESFRYYRLKQLVDDLQRKSIKQKAKQSRHLQEELQRAQTQLELTRYLSATDSPMLPEGVAGISAIIMSSDRETGQLLASTVQKAGISECRLYSNPETAAAHFSGIGPADIVLSEWSSETLKGEQLLKAIRTLPALTRRPIFLVMVYSDKLNELEKILDSGVDEYLVMPFSMKDFLRKISETVAKRSASGDGSDIPDMSGYHILIVNKDIQVVKRLRKIMTEEGVKKIQVAKTGAAAMSLMQNEPFDLVFYDVSIVDPYWHMFHEQLKLKRLSHSHFIMLVTGRDNRTMSPDEANSGALITLLTEPYSPARVRGALKSFYTSNDNDRDTGD